MTKKLSRELIAQKAKSDRLESIRNLNLWGSNLEDISILEEMPSLEIVSLSVNKIRTLKPFSNLQNLRELYLRQNLISNLNEIKHLTECQNLTVLWLNENPICDNPNYRAVVICVLPQLHKLDNIPITDEERDKAEKKLSRNYEENDEEEFENNQNQEEVMEYPPNNYNNKSGKKESNKVNYEDKKYYNKQNTIKDIRNKNKIEDKEINSIKLESRKSKPIEKFNHKANIDMEDKYFNKNKGNNGRIANKNQNFKTANNNYDEDNYKDDYLEKTQNKKKGNSNVLNVVINLLKELSMTELQTVKREIDRINNY